MVSTYVRSSSSSSVYTYIMTVCVCLLASPLLVGSFEEYYFSEFYYIRTSLTKINV